ncbi:hypothetical protein [Frankia sp. QA3]|uniref:hypothetical protein n=1 Tax=Frankia sp. QA3 TaxID=710111 RepID=UPI000269CD73|nr:hypothetical protein [Frankia sp. QA3]EIV95670.1 hypothetical protein FraQA3DRAFT_5511 [Frankia sp. QA3]
MRVLLLVLEGLLGTILIAFAYRGIYWLVSRRRRRPASSYAHACAALGVVCLLVLISLTISAIGFANQPLLYDLCLAGVSVALIKAGVPVWPSRPLVPALPTPSRALLLAVTVAALSCSFVVSWSSASVVRRPVTEISARSTDGKVEIKVVRGHGDARAFGLQIAREDGSLWTRPVPAGDVLRFSVDARDIGDPRVATVQLMVGSYAIRSTEIED